MTHKRQDIEFSQNLLEEITKWQSEVVYISHSSVSGKALVTWSGLVVTGRCLD